jgi:hypothetical protein
MPPVRALVYLDPMGKNLKQQSDGLKRLSVIFDEIVYVNSEWWMLKEGVASDPQRFRPRPDGSLFPAGDYRPFVDGFSPLDDVVPGFVFALTSWPAEIQETVLALQEAGVAREVTRAELDQLDPSQRIEHLRSLFVEADWKDDKFVSIQSPSGKHDFTFGRFTFEPIPGHSGPDEVHYIDFPDAIDDSVTITHTLYHADTLSANAVFLQPQFRRELDHRYGVYRDGIQVLNQYAPEVAASLTHNARFGEVAFNIANEIISSTLLEQKSLDQLLRFRHETNGARQRFITKGLAEIEEMVAGNPWSPTARSQMRQYVEKKLTPDIIDYNDQTRDVWRKLYGNIGVNLAKVTSAAVLSGTAASQAGGLLGNIMPNATGHSLLVIGALAGAVKFLPDFAEDLKNAIEEATKTKKSSIAYVSRLSRLK